MIPFRRPLARTLSNTIRYSKTHEWIQNVSGNQYRVGVSEYAKKSLGDIVYVELPEVGRKLQKNDSLGVVESVKGVSDLYSPVTGILKAVNEKVIAKPSLINKPSLEDSWLCEVEVASIDDVNSMLSEGDYKLFWDKVGTGIPIQGSMPIFKGSAEQLDFLHSPKEFYDLLMALMKDAKQRIIISSLYIGSQSEREKALWEQLKETMEREKYSDTFRCKILLDNQRAFRPNDNVGERLQALSSSYTGIFSHCLLQPPKQQLPLARLFSGRVREIFGVMHMKFYVFDDTVIVSGANLGDSYFTNRMDRYLVIRNWPQCADYYETLIDVATRWNNRVLPPLRFSDARKVLAQKPDGEGNLTLSMTTSNLLGGFKSDLVVSEKPSHVTLMSAYLNMHPAILQNLKGLLGEGSDRLTLITASAESNGFGSAKGLSKYIPKAYDFLISEFLSNSSLKDNLQRDHLGNGIIHTYDRTRWTFHGKGLELSYPDKTVFYFGSSNYGYRSVVRDVENQIRVETSSPVFREKLRKETDLIMRHCSKKSADSFMARRPSFITRWLFNAAKSFF